MKYNFNQKVSFRNGTAIVCGYNGVFDEYWIELGNGHRITVEGSQLSRYIPPFDPKPWQVYANTAGDIEVMVLTTFTSSTGDNYVAYEWEYKGRTYAGAITYKRFQNNYPEFKEDRNVPVED